MSNGMEETYTLPATIGVHRVDDKVDLSFSGLLNPLFIPLEKRERNDWSAIEGISQYVSVKLSAVQRLCSLPTTEETRDEAIRQICSIGSTVLSKLLGGNRDRWRGGLGPGTLSYGPSVKPIMDVELSCSNGLVLPLEILPLLNPLPLVEHPALLLAASMIGFGAACHRPTSADRANAETGNLDSNKVQFYWHADLKGARKQWKSLGEQQFDRQGPHPAKGQDQEVLANLILDKGSLASIEHFHCHHERADNESSGQQDTIRLKTARTWRSWFESEIWITATDISKIGRPKMAGFTFLNCCSSQFVSPRAVGSFVRELLLNGRNAVISTWCDVPDDVAYLMAIYFYEAFRRGDTVGASLREARIRLLVEDNNPLGLLYTIYGDSQYRL